MRAATLFALSGALGLALAIGGPARATTSLGQGEEPTESVSTQIPGPLPSFSSTRHDGTLGDVEEAPLAIDSGLQASLRKHPPVFLDLEHVPMGAIDEGYQSKAGRAAEVSLLMMAVLMGLGALSFAIRRVALK